MSNRSSRRSKTVYQRIEETELNIQQTEEKLAQLKSTLIELNKERENLEMHQLFNLIKSNGISFEQAKSILTKE